MQPAESNKITLSSAFKFSQMSMDDFRLLSVLGRGHFGKVNFFSAKISVPLNPKFQSLGNFVST